MNAKQKRTLIILLVIVVLLAAAVLGVRAAKNRAQQKKEDETEAAAKSGVITDTTSAYKELSYCNGSATLSFALNDEGQWYWTDSPDFPLDQDYLTKMVNTLSALKPQQTITDGDTLDAYGLSEPAQTLTAISDNGQTTTLALGNATTDGNSYYMLMNGSETPVYVISDELEKEMAVGIYDMYLLPDFPTLTEDQLNSITLAGPVTTVLTAAHEEVPAAADSSSSDDTTPTTTWRSVGANVTDNEQVQGIVKQILGLSLDACVDYRPSDSAAALCGFDKPDAVITVKYTGEGNTDDTLTLTVGSQVLDGDGRYVRVDDDTTVYRMKADKLDMLMKVSVNGLENAAASTDAASSSG
jgi:type II secretory pathway pseudopilin PulG